MRLIGQHTWSSTGCVLLPGTLEFRPIPFWAVAIEEFAVRMNAGCNEILRGLLENRTSFFAVRPQ